MGRAIHANAFVRPFVVVDRPKLIEDALLISKTARATKASALLERLVHAFVTRVLFGVPRHDEYRLDVEFHQADAEGRQTTHSVTAERRAIVTEDGQGKAVLPKHTLNHRPSVMEADRRERFAREEVSAHTIGHGQGVAPAAVPQTKLAFKVDRRQLARLGRCVSASEGRLKLFTSPSGTKQSFTLQDRVDGRSRRPMTLRIFIDQAAANLFR